MSKNKFKSYVKKKIEIAALKYLKSEIRSKGKELEYTTIEMQKYLQPESKMKMLEKQDAFKIRTRTLDIKENMKQKYSNIYCEACRLEGIKKKETQKHIYKCTQLKSIKRKIKYKEIFGSKISKIKQVLNRMNTNLQKRNLITQT